MPNQSSAGRRTASGADRARSGGPEAARAATRPGTRNGTVLRVVDTGLLCPAEAGTCRAVYTFPTLTALSNGRLLVTAREGSGKGSEDGTALLLESRDNGRCWQRRAFPVPAAVNGRRGSVQMLQLSEIEPGRVLAALMWMDRETYPGQPLFNPETEGLLPSEILLSDSFDSGATWSDWRVVPMPAEIGPPSLTGPVLKLAGGTLALSIETNKTYEDASRWYQKVVLFFSTDQGRTWGPPVTAGCDPSGRIFNWDQRVAVTPDGRLVAFLWTYDSIASRYLNVHRRLSSDGGRTWSPAEDLGFADQPGQPAILADGRVVLPYVDRFGSQSIRVRCAADAAAPFRPDSETVLYALPSPIDTGPDAGSTTATLTEMGVWTYGLPCAETLADGDVLVVFYAGDDRAMDIRRTRLRLAPA